MVYGSARDESALGGFRSEAAANALRNMPQPALIVSPEPARFLLLMSTHVPLCSRLAHQPENASLVMDQWVLWRFR